MRIKYLGTAAAEGIPALFCNCPICRQAKQNGGKDIRTRSQVLINDDLLVDFPADSFMHKLSFGIDFSKIETVLITHSHPDHLYSEDFGMRGSHFAHDITAPTLNVVMSERSAEVFNTHPTGGFSKDVSEHIIPHLATPYVSIDLGGYSITPLPARHAPRLGGCLIYLIKQGGKTILYANDTGILFDETYEFLKGTKIDLISFDCTMCNKSDGTNHMGIPNNLLVIEKLRSIGAVSDEPKLVITHFSHNGEMLYDALLAAAAPHSLIVAYDGLEIEL